MEYIVTATAGHVDHGKTTLIKRLTGTDTDTAPEEKKRGLTINLGFAYFDLPSKRRMAFVDVPGHEKFLKNMISGLTGIDMALLVVDAGEGVMPQTREHAEILTLLGIKNFVIAVTKADTVDEKMCQLTVEDIRETFKNTPLDNAPLVITDAVSGRGINQLIATLDQAAGKLNNHCQGASPRLNIDRVFTIKGHGTIVTGTLIDGTIKTGTSLEIYPAGIKVRVKNIQVNDTNQQIADAGHRVALNIDVNANNIHKGEVLTTKGNLVETKKIDVKLQMLSKVPSLKLNERIRLYIGSVEVFGRIYPMERDIIQKKESCFAQLRLEKPIAIKNGDRFIIRTYSPLVTVAGGVVLSANAKHHSRNNQTVIHTLKIRDNGEISAIILDYLAHVENKAASEQKIIDFLNDSRQIVQKNLKKLVIQGKIIKLDNYYLPSDYVEKSENKIMDFLNKSQIKYPLQRGFSRPDLISKINNKMGINLGTALVYRLEKKKIIKIINNTISTKNFVVKLTIKQKNLKKELIKDLEKDDMTPVKIKDLRAINVQAALPILDAFEGTEFVRFDDNYYLGTKTYNKISKIVIKYLTNHPEGLNISKYRDLMHTSRKYALMILERLDKDNITKRQGRMHVLNR